jgi:transcriptional regulator with XRE-family HTH domain
MDNMRNKVSTLKELIERKGLTQRSLAQKTGIKEVTINSWVSKGIYPTVDNAVKVAIALEVDLKTLFCSMGLDVTGLISDSDVSIQTNNHEEIVTVIKTIVKSLNIDPSSITD